MEEEKSAVNILEEFYKIITTLKNEFPYFSPEEFKNFINDDDELKEELNDLVIEFKKEFNNIHTSDKDMLNMLIALSTIGIEIPKSESV
jgi:hypothetical protein